MQLVGDCGVAEPSPDGHGDLSLALGGPSESLLRAPGRVGVGRHSLQQPTCDLRREDGFTSGHTCDGLDDLGPGQHLSKEPACAGAQRAEDVLVGIDRGQNDDLRWLRSGAHSPGCGDPVDAPQAHVHQESRSGR